MVSDRTPRQQRPLPQEERLYDLEPGDSMVWRGTEAVARQAVRAAEGFTGAVFSVQGTDLAGQVLITRER